MLYANLIRFPALPDGLLSPKLRNDSFVSLRTQCSSHRRYSGSVCSVPRLIAIALAFCLFFLCKSHAVQTGDLISVAVRDGDAPNYLKKPYRTSGSTAYY